jgi:tetratricopeptide (TPR) repeat protein
LLYEAYLRYAQQSLAHNDFDEAGETYQKALRLVPDSESAQEGLQEVAVARAAPFWEEVAELWEADTQESWLQIVSNLEQIVAIDSQAVDASDGISVTLKLYQAHIAWGDHLFADDISEANEHYDMAHSLLPDHPVVEARLAWVDRAQILQQEDVSLLAALVEEINHLAMEQPDLEDPFGRSIQQWLYKARVAYGSALLNQSEDSDDASIDAASFQAMTAMTLALESDDNGESARLLQQRAERMLAERQDQTYILEEPVALEAGDWTRILREYDLPAQTSGQLINLIVLTPVAHSSLQLSSADGIRPLVSNAQGVAIAALDEGSYILSMQSRDTQNEVMLDYSITRTYLVRVRER